MFSFMKKAKNEKTAVEILREDAPIVRKSGAMKASRTDDAAQRAIIEQYNKQAAAINAMLAELGSVK